jgi:hypothetical protein
MSRKLLNTYYTTLIKATFPNLTRTLREWDAKQLANCRIFKPVIDESTREEVPQESLEAKNKVLQEIMKTANLCPGGVL